VETASLFCKYSRVDIAEVRRFESYPPDKGILQHKVKTPDG